jgi:ABC-type branched-subunit amino acid transport system ATPase component
MKISSTQEFNGLFLSEPMETDSSIVAIVGRNGAGKTRLLQGISNGKCTVHIDSSLVPRESIKLLDLGGLSPQLIFEFDALAHREAQRAAIALYDEFRGRFNINPVLSISKMSPNGAVSRRANPSHVAIAVSHASTALGKDVNDLTDQDVADFYSSSATSGLGVLNVTATMREYWDRRENNELIELKNERYSEDAPFLSPQEFVARYGSPPWEVLNKVLKDIMGGCYELEEPNRGNISTYTARFFRVADKKWVDPLWFSSGEKTLMWLALCMYSSMSSRPTFPPKLLLLDEPDSALHPQMVQKFHLVLDQISNAFDLAIIFSTHSPTSVAIFNSGPILQVTESAIFEVSKDLAIAELLVGLDHVLVNFSKYKKVYVESSNDEVVYTEIFQLLRRYGKIDPGRVALQFIPAAAKLPLENIRNLVKLHFPAVEDLVVEQLSSELNGQGSCAAVYGAIEALRSNDSGPPVYGIVDWDLKNSTKPNVHVLGVNLFYNIENAVLNPLTLGLYLLHNFQAKMVFSEFGLVDDVSVSDIYDGTEFWQGISDGVTRRVLKVDTLQNDLSCCFLNGEKVLMDSRYLHMNGHALEANIREIYPCLKGRPKRPTFLVDVVRQGMGVCGGRSIPVEFANLFGTIQREQT